MRWPRRLGAVLVGALVLLGARAVQVRFLGPFSQDSAPPLPLVREPLRPGRATLLFAGDTGLGDAAEPMLVERGYEYPFRATIDLVRDVDVAVVNVEMPITARGRRFPLYKDYVYRSRPEAAAALAWAGFDIVTLANNHATDYGDEGLLDTIAAAQREGMVAIGAGPDEATARRGVIMKIGDVRVGLVAYCERQVLWSMYVDQFARGGHAGVAGLSEAALQADLARLRPEVDVLVVALHLGYNYVAPTAATLAWSRRAIELGADLVVDHHPHVAHPLTLHRGRPIALSIGNYAFGTPGHGELDYGQLLYAEIEGRRLARIEVVPIAVQNQRVAFQPQPLAGPELDHALRQLIEASRARGAELARVGDRAVLKLERPAE